MDKKALSANLRRLRISNGKSQVQLAETAELSRVGYRAIETGTVVPRVDTLARIAAALGVGIDALLAPARRLEAVRFRAQKKMTSREQVLVEVAGWLADYNELEAALGEKASFALGQLSKKVTPLPPSEERPKKAAVLAREAIGLSDGHDEMIRDICGLLEEHGVKVITRAVASEGFFGLSVAQADGGPAVVVNTWDRIPVERWIFTAAHELAHLILHPDSFDVDEADEIKSQEKEANSFASYFLMPEALFDDAWEEARGLPLVRRVLKVKSIFHVSYKTVLYRIAETKGAKNIWARFQAEYKNSFGKTLGIKDEPERLHESAFVTDRLNRLVRTAVDSRKLSVARAAEILGIEEETVAEYMRSWATTR